MSLDKRYKELPTVLEQIALAGDMGVQVQIALAHNVAFILRTNGFDEIETRDLLDAMAVAGVHLTHGADMTSEAYLRVIS